MNLCCMVNSSHQCILCKGKFCKEHLYKTSGSDYMEYPSDQHTCLSCYDIKVRKPFLSRKRKGMTFKELFSEARLLLPHGYLSVDVSIDDHTPGQNPPSLEWTIYHEKYKFIKGKTPEATLEELRKQLELPSLRKEQIDI